MNASEGEREPSNAELLAAITSLAQSVAGVAVDLRDGLDAVGARFDLVDSRGTEAKQTLEALSDMAYNHRQALDALPGHLDAVIAKAEARLTSRVSDVQQVVQTLKADLAAHTSDPNVHRP